MALTEIAIQYIANLSHDVVSGSEIRHAIKSINH